MSRPPIKVDFSSRDYNAIRSDLITLVNQQLRELYPNLQWNPDDPSDFGVVLLEAFAYMGDIMSYYIDRAANEMTIDNAILKTTLYNMAQLYGYRPSGPTQALTNLEITNTTEETISLPVGTQVVAVLNFGELTEVYYELTEPVIDLGPEQAIVVNAIEGKTANTDVSGGIDEVTNLPLPVLLVDSIGNSVSSGLPNQERLLPEKNVVDGSINVYVGQAATFNGWKFIDNLIEAGPADQVFTTKVDAQGNTYIVFGDGVNGSIPAAGQTLSALYKVSAGSLGNVDILTDLEVSFIPGSSLELSSVDVKFDAAPYGGADPDDLSQLRRKIKQAIASRKRAVTIDDYEYLTGLVPRVGRAKAYSENPRSVTIYMQTQDDGSLSPGWDDDLEEPTANWDFVSNEVQEYLADKIPVGTSVTILPPVYTDLTITITVTADSNYRNLDVQQAVVNKFVNMTDGIFAYERYGFGDTVPISDIIYYVMGVPGVRSLNINVLDTLDPGTAYEDVLLEPNQLPRLKKDNLVVYISGGIGEDILPA